ncbi:MAG: hypothetical protein ABI846_12245 [Rudaea sp.]
MLLLALDGRAATAGDDGDQPSATPYRPTVSNPADLPVPGWLEFEAGASSDHQADASHVDTLPWLLKYAFDENSGILVGGNAFERVRGAGQRDSGFGDTFIEYKRRLPVQEGIAFGVEAGVELPTAPAAIGIGKPAWIVNGIFSSDFGAAHVDLNLGGTYFSDHVAQASAWQSTWAVALSHPITAALGAALEMSGNAQRGAGHSHQGLAALNYNASRRIVFDVGVAYGLDRAAHDRSLFCGGTFLLGRIR